MTLTEKLTLITSLEHRLSEHEAKSYDLYHDICDVAKLVSQTERASLFTFDSESKQLTSLVCQGLASPIHVDLGKGLVGWCALQKEVIIECDVDVSKHFDGKTDISSGYITKNTMLMPLLNSRNQTLGILQVLNKDNGDYSTQDELLLARIAELLVKCL